MTKQELSVLLETISFFFVGIDLYGRDRLQRMQESILEFTEKLKTKITQFSDFQWSKNRRSKFMVTVYIVAGLIVMGFLAKVYFLDRDPLFEHSIGDVIRVAAIALILYIGVLLGLLVAAVVLLFLIIGLTAFINLLIRGMIWTFQFYEIEGLFLFIGTVLFLWSKYFQLY